MQNPGVCMGDSREVSTKDWVAETGRSTSKPILIHTHQSTKNDFMSIHVYVQVDTLSPQYEPHYVPDREVLTNIEFMLLKAYEYN